MDEKTAKAILGKMLSFIFVFAKAELKQDFEKDFKVDDTWLMLLEECYEFAEEHGARISTQLSELDLPTGTCPACGQETVDLISEMCALCGHLYKTDEDD